MISDRDRESILPGGAELRVQIPSASGAVDDGLAVRADLPFHEAKQRVIDAFERRYLQDLLARAKADDHMLL